MATRGQSAHCERRLRLAYISQNGHTAHWRLRRGGETALGDGTIVLEISAPNGYPVRRRFSGPRVVFGRDGHTAHLHLHDDELVSRRHGEITWSENRVFVRDFGSSNGTWFQGEARESFELVAGESFWVGGSCVRLIDFYAPAALRRLPTPPQDAEISFADTDPRLTPIALFPPEGAQASATDPRPLRAGRPPKR